MTDDEAIVFPITDNCKIYSYLEFVCNKYDCKVECVSRHPFKHISEADCTGNKPLYNYCRCVVCD